MTAFPALCRSLGLPEPVSEYRFATRLSPPRNWRFDWAFIDARLALEIEGGLYTKGRHVRIKGFKDDLEKYNTAAVLGWRIIRCLPQQMASGEVLRWVERALRQERYA